MKVKDLKSQLEFFNDELDVAITIHCPCGNTHYLEPMLVTDELQNGDDVQRFLVIEPNLDSLED